MPAKFAVQACPGQMASRGKAEFIFFRNAKNAMLPHGRQVAGGAPLRTLARPSLERNGRPQSPSADWTRRRTSSPKTASPRPAGGAFHASQSRAPGMLFLGNWLFALVGHMPTQGGGGALSVTVLFFRAPPPSPPVPCPRDCAARGMHLRVPTNHWPR